MTLLVIILLMVLVAVITWFFARPKHARTSAPAPLPQKPALPAIKLSTPIPPRPSVIPQQPMRPTPPPPSYIPKPFVPPTPSRPIITPPPVPKPAAEARSQLGQTPGVREVLPPQTPGVTAREAEPRPKELAPKPFIPQAPKSFLPPTNNQQTPQKPI